MNKEEVIAMARLGIPIAWIPKLIEQRDRELREGKTQRKLESDQYFSMLNGGNNDEPNQDLEK